MDSWYEKPGARDPRARLLVLSNAAILEVEAQRELHDAGRFLAG